MATAPTQVRIDADVKKEAAALSKDLGLYLIKSVHPHLMMKSKLP